MFAPFLRLRLLLAIAPWSAVLGLGAVPQSVVVPSRADTVLAIVGDRTKVGTNELGGDRTLKELRARLRANPRDEPTACRVAEACLARYRRDGDGRFLGFAQGAVRAWDADTRVPAWILLWRGIVRQSLHEFGGALQDLREVVRLEPRDSRAKLHLLAVLLVTGERDAAKQVAVSLASHATPLVALAAAASVGSVAGQAESSALLLERALDQYPGAGSGERQWAQGLLAETWARLGRVEKAEAAFRRQIASPWVGAYDLASYADWLLDQGRAAEVLDLLSSREECEGLLLRRAIAAARAHPAPAGAEDLMRRVGQGFEHARQRGDALHLREEARYWLVLRNDPSMALKCARENWKTQKEPADARVLLESAIAARNRPTAREVTDWVAKVGLEDVALRSLALRARALAE